MHPVSQTAQQALVVDWAEELRHVQIHHDLEPRFYVLLRFGDGGVRTTIGTEPWARHGDP